MTEKEEMIKLRERGLSYQKIADIYHISKQRVHQIIGKERVRKNNTDIERIVYKGIYDFMKENPTISYSALLRKIRGCETANQVKNFSSFLKNSNDKSRLSILEIKRLIEFTGKSFEELFERR